MVVQSPPTVHSEAEHVPAIQQLSPELLAEYHRAMQALITEDDQPVDNLFSERQQRLLADSLEASWAHPKFGKRFLVAVNVGVFHELYAQALVPDLLLSVGVQPRQAFWEQEGKSYFTWVYGKPPELVVEVVSNGKGEELGRKAEVYAWMGVRYYVVYDPRQELGETVLHVLENTAEGWQPVEGGWLRGLSVGVTTWQGEYGGLETIWLRWCDREGNILSTGLERAEPERQRAERLAAKLRELGIDPERV